MRAVLIKPALASTRNRNSRDKLLEKDRWPVEALGVEPDQVHSSYYLDFSRINPPWLKDAAKRFVRFQSSIKSYASCRSYIAALARFSDYLDRVNRQIQPEEINRRIAIGFFEYLKEKNYSSMTRVISIVHLRTFHLVMLQENWLPWPDKPIVFHSDIPKSDKIYPRYIPEDIIKQLKDSLHHLDSYMQRFIVILLETGRRIGEICSMEYKCLEQDDRGDWYMRVKEKKLKKVRLIPISNSCLNVVKQQQAYLLDRKQRSKYLFPARGKSKSSHISARTFNLVINELSQACKIKDANGRIWRFQSHQFRHTLGTSMINNGVPQVVVQQYLGHESPEMTARYAHIHNETLKKAFKRYQDKLIDIHGKAKSAKKILDARWLRNNIISQALPNGLCQLPLAKQSCPHANACLTCGHFCTNKSFLAHHKRHLKQTEKIIVEAKKNGWKRIVEMNMAVSKSLTLIINRLESEK